jgi:mannose-6-phosphate isomerase-like protein (cupin superfamily)
MVLDSVRRRTFMPHILAKQDTNLPPHLTIKISPVDTVPKESYICDYGVDTLTAGASSEKHFHDCDVWWIIVNGIARVLDSGKNIEAGPGDMIFTHAGDLHRIEGITMVTYVWIEGPLKGQKRKGQLSPESV